MTPYPSDGGARVEYALAYAMYGWRLIPLHHVIKGRCTCRRNDCQGPGKHPRIVDWPSLATAEADTIQGWWSKWPEANIGLATGSGLIDIECEAGHEDNIERLEAELGGLPDTVTWISGGGGVHRLFRTSVPIRNATRIGAQIIGAEDTGIDVRGERGLAVLPPSNHKSGVAYRWGNLTPDEIEPAALPEAWELFLTEAVPKATTDIAAGSIPEGSRNSALARQAGSMRRIGMSESAILAALIETNRERCEPPLPDEEVSAIAASIARYEPDQAMVAVVEGHWEQDQAQQAEAPPDPGPQDPGPLPPELLRVPGFVNEVMDYTLSIAPFPEPTLAFCGALTLQAMLAGRKIREPGGARTNLYVLGLANSGAGKDHPRKVNQLILANSGLAGKLGDSFASGEGIEDRMLAARTMLFQTDEIDTILLGISRSRDGRAERIMEILLRFYSASDGAYLSRAKAGKEPQAVDQPCLVLFGTAIPKHYYESLCEKMLTNGFFARMLVFEAGPRGEGQEPNARPIPPPILEAARWWATFRPVNGNLDDEHPTPAVAPLDQGALERLQEVRAFEVASYNAAQQADDAISMAVWARAGEKTRRLALVYACSANRQSPTITREAVDWAWSVVRHQTCRMLFQAGRHVADTEFDGQCRKLVQILQDWQAKRGDRWMEAWRVSRKMRLSVRELDDVREALVQQRQVEYTEHKTGGRPTSLYRLAAGGLCASRQQPVELIADQEGLLDRGRKSRSLERKSSE